MKKLVLLSLVMIIVFISCEKDPTPLPVETKQSVLETEPVGEKDLKRGVSPTTTYYAQVDQVMPEGNRAHFKVLLDRVTTTNVYANVRVFAYYKQKTTYTHTGSHGGPTSTTSYKTIIGWKEIPQERGIVYAGNRYSAPLMVPPVKGSYRIFLGSGFASGASVLPKAPVTNYVLQVDINALGNLENVSWVPNASSWFSQWVR